MVYELIDDFHVAAPVEATWDLMCTPANLPRLTPPWMRFRVATRGPVVVGPNAQIDYTMAWKGVPLRWRSLITEYERHRRLAYIQLRGPYAMWLHQHVFERAPDGGTRVLDRCLYSLPFGLVGDAVHWLAVRHQVVDIFAGRRARLAGELGRVTGIDGPRIQPAETRASDSAAV